MTMNREEVIHDALKASAEAMPNSIIGDLMMLFPDDIVLKFVSSFAGMIISVPRVETIWKAYRNAVICDTLLLADDKQNRARLAEYFGISTSRVSHIFNDGKKTRKRPDRAAIRRAATIAYRSKFNEIVRDARGALTHK